MAFESFEARRIAASGCEVNLVVGGSGPPLLLLHGYPQTHFMWHKVAPRLAEHYTVVASDLRGYGDSGRPADGDNHAGHCKRASAQDQVETMAALGFEQFMVAGHDRGARVAHRMALDHPERVAKLSVLDIVPTRRVFADVSQALATAYYHWFFLIQPAPFPETLIGNDPEYYLRWVMGRWGTAAGAITDEAFAEYLRCFARPETIHASCEDYRAAASIDLDHDAADGERRIACPVQALWGARAVMHRMYDVVAVWREYAGDVRGQAVDCGHFLPEEAPEETWRALHAFFSS
ncbi:MAG TPA: alpha/beta hydrolase [Alphaproteobacteria bacterium]